MEFTSAFHLKSANPVLFKNGSDPTQAERYGRATALLVGLSWPQIAGAPPSPPGPTRESPLSWDTGQENQPSPLTRLALHTCGETGVKSFVHNLLLDQGLLHSSSSFTEINWQSPLDTKHYNKNRRERKRKEGRKGGREEERKGSEDPVLPQPDTWSRGGSRWTWQSAFSSPHYLIQMSPWPECLLRLAASWTSAFPKCRAGLDSVCLWPHVSSLIILKTVTHTHTHTCVKVSYKLKELTKVNIAHGHSLA